jgi:hypothetical protein
MLAYVLLNYVLPIAAALAIIAVIKLERGGRR